MSAARVELYVYGGLAIVGVLVLAKIAQTGKGLLTGDNALTKNATDANGDKVTAYQGAGPIGTLGAAANAVSGGWLASAGEWFGGGFYDLTHPGDPASTAPGADGVAPVSVAPTTQLDVNGQPVTSWDYQGGA